MSYVFQFGVVWEHLPDLLAGAWLTITLSTGAFMLGFVIAVACAAGRSLGPRAVRLAVSAYVEVIRNTPLLVQLFVIYFSLPALGLRMDAGEAALVGLALNFGGYATEIIRSGIEAVSRGQLEAGRALGLSWYRIFRHIVLVQALTVAYPALASQFILLLLGSSIVSAISAQELTAVTNTLQSTTFRSFEFYFVATALYLAMALAARLLLDGVYWTLLVRGRAPSSGRRA
ncbi:amino acid ABC transporter permease [Elioraea rosea]|uniref:amino acid ABC transporter permease n=1 Tax=Elioraea rosea TaxID=2492390 RepID=UPI0011829B00|nr:amino acid ABC transporter permease [Elioraea rosea]